MANDNDLGRKVEAIDRKAAALKKVLDKQGMPESERTEAFHREFMKTLATWGVTEDQYVKHSIGGPDDGRQ